MQFEQLILVQIRASPKDSLDIVFHFYDPGCPKCLQLVLIDLGHIFQFDTKTCETGIDIDDVVTATERLLNGKCRRLD